MLRSDVPTHVQTTYQTYAWIWPRLPCREENTFLPRVSLREVPRQYGHPITTCKINPKPLLLHNWSLFSVLSFRNYEFFTFRFLENQLFRIWNHMFIIFFFSYSSFALIALFRLYQAYMQVYMSLCHYWTYFLDFFCENFRNCWKLQNWPVDIFQIWVRYCARSTAEGSISPII